MKDFMSCKCKGTLNDIINNLKNVDKLVIKDKKIKMSPTLSKCITSILAGKKHMSILDL
jgi:hypothetical protein